MRTHIRSHWLSMLCGVFVCLMVLAMGGPAAADEKPATAKNGERVELDKYPSGAVRERSVYRNGLLAECTWFRPDGSVLDTTDFAKHKVGWHYRLRDDGSIRIMWQCDSERICQGDIMVHGLAIFMSPDQKESITLHYKDGVVQDNKRHAEAHKLVAPDQPAR